MMPVMLDERHARAVSHAMTNGAAIVDAFARHTSLSQAAFTPRSTWAMMSKAIAQARDFRRHSHYYFIEEEDMMPYYGIMIYADFQPPARRRSSAGGRQQRDIESCQEVYRHLFMNFIRLPRKGSTRCCFAARFHAHRRRLLSCQHDAPCPMTAYALLEALPAITLRFP